MKEILQHTTLTECPAGALGQLPSSDRPIDISPLQRHDDVIINGVRLSPQVMEELRRLGISLDAYSSSELLDAVHACHYDGNLLDDLNGVHFRDMLDLSNREKISDSLGIPHSRMRIKTTKHGPHASKDILAHEEEEEHLPKHRPVSILQLI
ncbi:MAG: hypothetical protein AB7F82_09160 [Alphaproteobacteria bacterium]